MKSEIVFVKSLKKYLKDIIRPILENPESLKSGRPYKNIKLSPREVLGAFLICLTVRYISNQDWTIARDTQGGDGIIWCRDSRRKSEGLFLEQVYVRLRQKGFNRIEIVKIINNEIKRKLDKGKEYAQNRNLIVYLDVKGELDYQQIKKFVDKIKQRFDSYWIFSRYSNNKDILNYIVFLLKAERDEPAAYKIAIDSKYEEWSVKKLGKL